MDFSLLGSSFHGISQVRILEWVAISFSKESSWPRDWTHASCIGKQILYHWAVREALKHAFFWQATERMFSKSLKVLGGSVCSTNQSTWQKQLVVRAWGSKTQGFSCLVFLVFWAQNSALDRVGAPSTPVDLINLLAKFGCPLGQGFLSGFQTSCSILPFL